MNNQLPAFIQIHSKQVAGSYTFSPQPASLKIDARLFDDLTTPGPQAVTPWTSNIETLFAESGDVNANLVLCQKPENGNHSKTQGLLPGDINALVEQLGTATKKLYDGLQLQVLPRLEPFRQCSLSERCKSLGKNTRT